LITKGSLTRFDQCCFLSTLFQGTLENRTKSVSHFWNRGGLGMCIIHIFCTLEQLLVSNIQWARALYSTTQWYVVCVHTNMPCAFYNEIIENLWFATHKYLKNHCKGIYHNNECMCRICTFKWSPFIIFESLLLKEVSFLKWKITYLWIPVFDFCYIFL
jgi:hypothetical protein